MNDLISIIIPVYNIENEVVRCLESVLNQTYDNIEIIVVNDGSTDNSGYIIDQFGEQYSDRIKVYHKLNGGVTSARLFGVNRAKGKWIGFIDGDDEIETDMYERLINNALNNNADISHCGFQMIFEDGRVHYFYNKGCYKLQNNIVGIKDLLEGAFIEPSLCNKLFQKKLFENMLHTNLMDTDIKINEDLLMNYYLFSESKLSVFEDVCKYHYLVRNKSVSRTKLNDNKIFDPIRVKKIILDGVREELKEMAQKAYTSTCINVYNTLILENKKLYQQSKKEVRAKIKEAKKWYFLLTKKQQILANLIYYTPCFYPVIYNIYAKIFLQKKYY